MLAPFEPLPQHPHCGQLTGLPRNSHSPLVLFDCRNESNGNKRSAADPCIGPPPVGSALIVAPSCPRVWQTISGDPAPDAALTLQSFDSACEEQQACLAHIVDNV